MNSLEKSILSTLIYYNSINQSLVGFEVFKYLIKKNKFEVDLNKVLNTLKNSIELKKYIDQKNGLYFLKNKDNLVESRIKRQIIADKKWKKARRVIKFLQAIPYIRLVAVSGSLAMNNTKEESDIDLLIVAKSGRIWTCRMLTTIFFHLIGQRRHGKLTKNRFCLNHYITNKSLKIPHKSLYNAQTYAHLVSLYQKRGLYKKFQKANSWIKEYLVNYPKEKKGYLNTVKINKAFKLIREFFELILDSFLGNRLELILKKIQGEKIKNEPLTYKHGGRVVFNDNQLEFHPDSPEKKILNNYNATMRESGFNESTHEKDSGLSTSDVHIFDKRNIFR